MPNIYIRDATKPFIQALETELHKLADTDSPDTQRRIQTHLGPTVRRATEILTRQTKRDDWTNRITGKTGRSWLTGDDRPSTRHQKAGRGDGPIYLNWGFRFDAQENHFSITNRSNHLGILLKGSPRHPIPLRRFDNKFLRFWRGRPLKWDADADEVSGWNYRRQVNHPGVEGMMDGYLDYFEDAYEEALADNRYEKNVTNFLQARVVEVRKRIIERVE